jgi:hypothetical protein
MAVRRYVVTATTDAPGNATAFSPFISGGIAAIHYIKTDYAAGVDFTITAEATGETIWTQVDVNATVSVAPRIATSSTAGVAAVYAGGGTAVNGMIRLGRDRVKIAIAQGGATKTGTFHIVVDEA